jgi:hypothetical protein
MSPARRVREIVLAMDQCVSAVRAAKLQVLVCLRSRCNHVIGVGGPYGL